MSHCKNVHPLHVLCNKCLKIRDATRFIGKNGPSIPIIKDRPTFIVKVREVSNGDNEDVNTNVEATKVFKKSKETLLKDGSERNNEGPILETNTNVEVSRSSPTDYLIVPGKAPKPNTPVSEPPDKTGSYETKQSTEAGEKSSMTKNDTPHVSLVNYFQQQKDKGLYFVKCQFCDVMRSGLPNFIEHAEKCHPSAISAGNDNQNQTRIKPISSDGVIQASQLLGTGLSMNLDSYDLVSGTHQFDIFSTSTPRLYFHQNVTSTLTLLRP